MADDPALHAPASNGSDQHPPTSRFSLRIPLVDLAGLVALAGAIAIMFAPQFVWMWQRWMNSEYYGHGLLVPPIAAYLVYRRREALKSLVAVQDSLGLGVVVAGVLVYLAGVQLNVNFISAFAVIPIVWGLAGWLWGRRVALAVMFPVCYLGFMIPIDRLLIDVFSSRLQLLAAKLATVFAQAISIPVTREGVNVSVPEYTFEVAIACSGLKSLITMTALAALYAYLLKGQLWRRALVVVASLPIALLANSVRVTTILLVVRSMGERAAEGFFHSFSGIVVFAVGLTALYGFGRLIGCYQLRDDI